MDAEIREQVRARLTAVLARHNDGVVDDDVKARVDEHLLPSVGHAMQRLAPAKRRVVGRKPSVRERAVLSLVAEGFTNPEIAEVLWIGEETVKTHLRSLLAKLGARNRAQLVTNAFRAQLLDL